MAIRNYFFYFDQYKGMGACQVNPGLGLGLSIKLLPV